MKISKQSRRDARQLFATCRADGVLDEERLRAAVGMLLERKPRGFFGILKHLHRLVKLDVASRSARIESAVALSSGQQTILREHLARLKGTMVSTEFVENPELIGGIRVRVGSDVFDGSIRSRLITLRDQF